MVAIKISHKKLRPSIAGHTLPWVRPGTGSGKIHPSAGRTSGDQLIGANIFID
jgi:hypothetical protein